MKKIFFLLVLFCVGCKPEPEPVEPADDIYVKAVVAVELAKSTKGD